MMANRRRGWWNVAHQELADLWVGGKALIFLILFSGLLGVMVFLLATNQELSLIPPTESVWLVLRATLAVGLFFGLVLGADTVSGERERATLESLLLTPTSRRDILIGKYIAAISPWPAAFVISIGYLAILAPTRTSLVANVVWGGVIGTLLVAALVGFGMIMSVWTRSNRTSLSLSLLGYVLFLIPTQFPGNAQTGSIGQLIKRLNPLEAANQFLEKILVNNRTPSEMASWLAAPIIFGAAVAIILIWFAPRALQLDVVPLAWRRTARGGGLAASILLVFLILLPQPARAAQDSDADVTIAVNVDTRRMKTGDTIEFQTEVGRLTDGSGPLVLAMNIVNLDDGDPVDPEDWSPVRTQRIEQLEKGQTTTLGWKINAILSGDYIVYIVVLPTPADADATALPVASTGVHLTIDEYVRINPGGVLPLAIGMPLGLTALMLVIGRRRRRLIDSGLPPVPAG